MKEKVVETKERKKGDLDGWMKKKTVSGRKKERRWQGESKKG